TKYPPTFLVRARFTKLRRSVGCTARCQRSGHWWMISVPELRASTRRHGRSTRLRPWCVTQSPCSWMSFGAQRLKWNAIVVTSRAASGLGATGSDRVHRCPGSALRFLLLCLCTPLKTTGGLRTHRNGVEARQLAADFAEAPPESIRLEHLHRPAKGREK